jgi:hypothetical protein
MRTIYPLLIIGHIIAGAVCAEDTMPVLYRKVLLEDEKISVIAKVVTSNRTYTDISGLYGWVWGTDGYDPETEIKFIVIHSDKTAIEVPLFAFDDLYNPSIDASFVCHGQSFTNFTCEITGGDGAGFYKASLLFTDGQFVERNMKYLYYNWETFTQSASELSSGDMRGHPLQQRKRAGESEGVREGPARAL